MTYDNERGPELVREVARAGPDTLERLYEFQIWYQRRLGYEIGGTEYARRNVLYAFSELAELLDELPWKWHRAYDWQVHKGRVVGEFADLLVFLLNVLLHCGVTDRELRRGIAETLVKNLGRLEDGTNTPA